MQRLAYFLVSLAFLGMGQAEAQLIVTKRNFHPDGTVKDVEIAEVEGNVVSNATALGNEKIRRGIDPRNDQQIFQLLVLPKVRQELAMSTTQTLALQKLMREMRSDRRKSVPSYDPGANANRSRQLSPARQVLYAQRAIRAAALTELLHPEQHARLREIAWRAELAQMGMDGALIDGYLGDEIEVSNQESDKIRRRVTATMEKAKKEIEAVLSRAEKEVLDSLAPDKRDRAALLLGEYFLYEIPRADDLAILKFLDADEGSFNETN